MRWNEYSSFLFCLTPLSYKVSSLQLVTNHLRAPFSFEEMYLNVSQKMMDLRKGTACSLESYSPFIENICIIIIRCYFPQKFRGYSGIPPPNNIHLTLMQKFQNNYNLSVKINPSVIGIQSLMSNLNPFLNWIFVVTEWNTLLWKKKMKKGADESDNFTFL